MVGNKKELVEYLLKQDNTKMYELKECKKTRSNDANAYCWVLCEMIATELSKNGSIIKKEEIYKSAIIDVGVFYPFIVEEKNFHAFKRIWESMGLGYQVQEIYRKNKCVKGNCYYGSSSYNTQEMSRLIQLLVQEAEGLEIKTKDKREIKELLNKWAGTNKE